MSADSFAVLGGDASSVQADVAYMQGSLRVKPAQSYSVHEIQLPTGTVVREYVSQQGKVFAIAWKGPFPPDLKQLLGPYFTPYQQAVLHSQQAHPGRSPVSVRQSNLVVQHGGRPRSVFGRAYLSDQLPSGVTEDSIQ